MATAVCRKKQMLAAVGVLRVSGRANTHEQGHHDKEEPPLVVARRAVEQAASTAPVCAPAANNVATTSASPPSLAASKSDVMFVDRTASPSRVKETSFT